jgi:hypothetical protein
MNDLELRFREALNKIANRTETISTVSGGLKLSEEDDEDEAIETTESDDNEKVAADEQAPPPHINFFQHPDSHPAVLDILLLQKYGPEWMTWEPETLQLRIPVDFKTQGVSDLNMSKIQAMKTLHFVDTPWKQWEVFTWCAMPLNNLFPDFEVMQVPTVAQCLVAIDIFNLVRQDTAWSDEVKAYLGTVWRHEGMFCPLDPADFITIDRTDVDVDCDKISERWAEVRRTGVAPTEDTAEAEQLRRMLDAHEYLKENRALFERQMKAVIGG